MEPEREQIPDVSEAYHLWNDLYLLGIRLALSTTGDTPEERVAARARLARAQGLALKERDQAWVRIIERMRGDRNAG
jgi:hypothetical protein